MTDLANDLNSFERFAAVDIRAWRKHNNSHEVVMQLVRKGAFFAKQGFPSRGYSKENSRSKTIKAAITSLVALLNCSYEPKKNIGQCEVMDVFHTGMASKALSSLFFRKGWSSHVWPEHLVEYSSFRSAIGMAMVVYAVYIKDAMARSDYERAMTQCADAFGLLVMDSEKKLSIKNKANRTKISEMPAQILSINGKKAVEKKLQNDPKQAEKAFVKDCWLEWQRNADRYNGKAAFARDMLSKCENLISQKKIEDWCRRWEKETAPS